MAIYAKLMSDFNRSYHLKLLCTHVLRVDAVDRNMMVKELSFLHRELSWLHMKGDSAIAPVLRRIQKIINRIDTEYIKSNSGNNPTTITQIDVCPEKYMGPKYGYMSYVTGWIMENCTNARPFEDVISVVLNPNVEEIVNCSLLELVIKGIRKSYRRITIVVPDYSCSSEIFLSIHQVTVDKNWTPGLKWNVLMKSVTTPYVYIGRDLDNFVGWISRLERQVRVISSIPRVQVAGGAVRNRTGHWQVGCYQSDMRNYVLRYEEGYFVSRNECMYCDYLMGPFVAKTELLKKIPFDEKLPSTVLFEDFFLKVKEQFYLVLNCPDAMHFASDSTVFQKEYNKQTWQPLVKKWELNRIVLSNGKVFGYSCEDSRVYCSGYFTTKKSYLWPPCCIEYFVETISIFHQFCLTNSIFYELEGGSVLGLVKLSNHLPWNNFGDITFYSKYQPFIEASYSHFEQHGRHFLHFRYRDVNETQSHFIYWPKSLKAEFWGEVNLSKDLYEPDIFKNSPTQAKFGDFWVYAPISPGLYARNRYGEEILHHVDKKINLKKRNSWETYRPGKFITCENSTNHACLDHFSTDGNFQFKIPTPN